MEYLLSHIATGTEKVRLRIAQPLRIFEASRCKYSTGSKKKKVSWRVDEIKFTVHIPRFLYCHFKENISD